MPTSLDPVVQAVIISGIFTCISGLLVFIPAVLGIYLALRRDKVQSDKILADLQEKYIKPIENKLAILELQHSLDLHRIAERDAVNTELKVLLAKVIGGIIILVDQVKSLSQIPKFMIDESLLSALQKHIEMTTVFEKAPPDSTVAPPGPATPGPARSPGPVDPSDDKPA